MKRVSMIAGALSALALAGGLALAAPGTARADVVPAGTWNEIVPAFTDQTACLDDPNGSATAGTHVQLYHCHGYASDGGPQRWSFSLFGNIAPGATAYRILSHNLCLGPNQSGGTTVDLITCAIIIGPLWTVISRNAFPGDPYVTLELGIPGDSPGCMALPDFSGSNHESVILEPCDNSNMLQYWVLD
jgi:hypothetical protein